MGVRNISVHHYVAALCRDDRASIGLETGMGGGRAREEEAGGKGVNSTYKRSLAAALFSAV